MLSGSSETLLCGSLRSPTSIHLTQPEAFHVVTCPRWVASTHTHTHMHARYQRSDLVKMERGLCLFVLLFLLRNVQHLRVHEGLQEVITSCL